VRARTWVLTHFIDIERCERIRYMLLLVAVVTFVIALLLSLPPFPSLPPYLTPFFKRRSPHHLRDDRRVGGNGVLQRAEGGMEDEGVYQVTQAPASQTEGFGHGEYVNEPGEIQPERKGGRGGGKKGKKVVSRKGWRMRKTRPRCLIKGEIGGREKGANLLMRTQRHMLGAFMQEMLVRLINHQPGPRRLTKRGNFSKEGLGADGTGGVAGRG